MSIRGRKEHSAKRGLTCSAWDGAHAWQSPEVQAKKSTQVIKPCSTTCLVIHLTHTEEVATISLGCSWEGWQHGWRRNEGRPDQGDTVAMQHLY